MWAGTCRKEGGDCSVQFCTSCPFRVAFSAEYDLPGGGSGGGLSSMGSRCGYRRGRNLAIATTGHRAWHMALIGR